MPSSPPTRTYVERKSTEPELCTAVAYDRSVGIIRDCKVKPPSPPIQFNEDCYLRSEGKSGLIRSCKPKATQGANLFTPSKKQDLI